MPLTLTRGIQALQQMLTNIVAIFVGRVVFVGKRLEHLKRVIGNALHDSEAILDFQVMYEAR